MFYEHLSPISLGYWPLEVVRPSLLASKLSSTYTLIGPWCKSMSKTFLIMFLELLFLKSCVMSGGLWCILSLLPGCFMVFFFFFVLRTWATCGGGHIYWVIFRHEARWPPRRSFICFCPLSKSLRGHRANHQLCFSIPNKQYSHCGAYEWDYQCLWPPFHLINLSWA